MVKNLLPLTIVMGMALGAPACGGRVVDPPPQIPLRIVAMAPSLTETLIALGLEKRIVGLTRYCPPVAGAVEVGGYFDPSYEAIVSLEPDLVLTMQSHDELHRRLGDLGLETLRVDQHDVAGILASVETVARRCGVEERGRELTDRLRAEMDDVAARVAGRDRPTTLVVVGRDPGSGRIGALWAAAQDTFYNDVLRLAGGENVLHGTTIRYPELSREGLLAVDAEVIFDVIADGGARNVDVLDAAADWDELADLRAVADGRIHVLVQDFVVIPGPRVVETVRVFAESLHPEVEWN